MAAVGTARADTYDLAGLLRLAQKHNPGIAASEQATRVIRGKLSEARRSWLPTGDFLTMIAPVPEVRCISSVAPPAGVDQRTWELDHCTGTDRREAATLNFSGVLSRTQLNLIQPLYTFGKISSGIDAAEAGIAASQSRTESVRGQLDFNVKRAYHGMKLMRAILETLDEGLGYITDAQDRIQKSLDEGDGTMSVTDKLRVQTVRAEVEARVLEAQKGVEIANYGIRALIGPTGPRNIEIDDAELTQVEVTERPESHYTDQAMLSRPDVRALEFYVIAQRKLADLEWAKQLPDLVLIGSATVAWSNSIDDPKNAFLNDPFNRAAAGVVAALRMPLDFGVRNAKAEQLAAEAEQAAYQRHEALTGIQFEVGKAYAEVQETSKRVEILAKGERLARSWMTGMIQKMELGLTEIKEITEALQAYFNMRLRHLQAIHDYNMAVAELTRATGSTVAN